MDSRSKTRKYYIDKLTQSHFNDFPLFASLLFHKANELLMVNGAQFNVQQFEQLFPFQD